VMHNHCIMNVVYFLADAGPARAMIPLATSSKLVYPIYPPKDSRRDPLSRHGSRQIIGYGYYVRLRVEIGVVAPIHQLCLQNSPSKTR